MRSVAGNTSAQRTFGRSRRIAHSAEFTRALRSPRRAADRLLVVSWCSNECMQARLGIAIGRRVSPRATRRNRVKRALREAFRKRCHALPAIDVVVLVRPACGMLPPGKLAGAVSEAFDVLLTRCLAPSSPHRK